MASVVKAISGKRNNDINGIESVSSDVVEINGRISEWHLSWHRAVSMRVTRSCAHAHGISCTASTLRVILASRIMRMLRRTLSRNTARFLRSASRWHHRWRENIRRRHRPSALEIRRPP